MWVRVRNRPIQTYVNTTFMKRKFKTADYRSVLIIPCFIISPSSTGVALLAGAPEKLPEHGKKSALKSKEDKPSTSVSTQFLSSPSFSFCVAPRSKKIHNRVNNQSEACTILCTALFCQSKQSVLTEAKTDCFGSSLRRLEWGIKTSAWREMHIELSRS